mgnify:CR=1 FL=1
MARAVGTSLAVIAINCGAGLMTAAADLDSGRIPVTAVFAALALVGTLASLLPARYDKLAEMVDGWGERLDHLVTHLHEAMSR